jgi:hypothetical protein
VNDYCARLRSRGFFIEYAALIPRPTALPGDVGAWVAAFAQSFTAPIAPALRPGLIAEVQAALRPRLCDAHGQWWADYVRLRFRAIKER